jgi:glucose-1-phosphate thymidylyltransferase
MAAWQFGQVIEERQGLKIACLEEFGYRKDLINCKRLKKLSASMEKTSYDSYLQQIVGQENNFGTSILNL